MIGSVRNRKNKAQISGQVFVYIMAVIIIGIIIFVGVKAIGSILKLGENVNIDSLKSDFQTAVEGTARAYGSVKKFQFNLPGKYDAICFVNTADEKGQISFDTSKITNSLIKSSVDSGALENVFLMKNGVWQDKFIAKNLDVKDDYLCLNNQGSVIVWLKGTGDKAQLFTQNG